MSFIRPEARAALLRWREALVAVGLLGVGLWWVVVGAGALRIVGAALLVAGTGLAAAGVQRARFRTGGAGPGVVRVDEGQIVYFGPVTGGAVALSEITEISLDRSGRPGHWVIAQPGQPDLCIPLNAEGADALFDAFASLPGLRTDHMLARMRDTSSRTERIWVRDTDQATALPKR
ncbi:hypothetical protein [Roseovarius salinarum]|uniref:hypothetical protein n=1 Tax=Roseovarius salinarum TaxID=1981892 RepID=UPI000C33620A|nr:hypothetical protein [Roseovarius salinarum]